MKICIDAGHGGHDSGAVGIGGRKEKDDNLRFALALQKRFEAGGNTVLMTRTADNYPSLSDRVKMANDAGVDVYISVHRNSADASAHGIETLISVHASKKSKEVAKAVQAAMISVGGRDRGVKAQANRVYVLDKTKMPACTVEIGFVTNAGDNDLFDSKFYQYADAVYAGVSGQFGGSVTPAPEPTEPSSVYDYVVTAGEARLRAAATSNSADLGVYPKGTKLSLESYYKGDKWARVIVKSTGKTGYMYWSYIGE